MVTVISRENVNDKIKELMSMCETIHTEYFDGRGNVTATYFDKEKFAELIIKDCISKLESTVLSSDIASSDYETGWDNGMFFAIGAIKDYFGVEE